MALLTIDKHVPMGAFSPDVAVLAMMDEVVESLRLRLGEEDAAIRNLIDGIEHDRRQLLASLLREGRGFELLQREPAATRM